ncbi:hypothetical protein Droror1_Dr00008229 [Drosera rotundifolia]
MERPHLDVYSMQYNKAGLPPEVFMTRHQMIQENQETAVDHGVASSSSSWMNNIGNPMTTPVYHGSSSSSCMNNVGYLMMPVYHTDEYQRIDMDDDRFTRNSEMSTMSSTSGATSILQQDVEAANRSEEAIKSSGKKIKHWTEQEHKLFLIGLEYYGKNKWGRMSRDIFHGTKAPEQIGSHAQKYFGRQKELYSEYVQGGSSGQGGQLDGVGSSGKKKKKSKRIHDINRVDELDLRRFMHDGSISTEIGAQVLWQRFQISSSMLALPLSSEQPMIPYDETNFSFALDDEFVNLMFD